MVIYVPGTEETDPKKQNMSLQAIAATATTTAASTATNTTNIASNTAAIAALNAATYVNSFNTRTGAVVPAQGDYPTSLIPGTITNNNATTGNIGEFISSSVASGITMSNSVIKDITTISLTAGDWDVWGSIVTVPAGTTTTSRIIGWVNTTSASGPTPPNGGAYSDISTAVSAGQISVAPVGKMRLSLSGTTTVYLTADIFFAVSTLTAGGFIGARRVR